MLRADHDAAELDGSDINCYTRVRSDHALGRLDFARTTSVAVHDWVVRALVRQHDDVALQRELSVSYNKLGDVAVAAGQLDAARRAYEQGLAIRERLATADPSNSAVAARFVGELHEAQPGAGEQKQHAEALRYFEKARVISTRLAQHDPSNAVWKNDLAWVQNRIAELT